MAATAATTTAIVAQGLPLDNGLFAVAAGIGYKILGFTILIAFHDADLPGVKTRSPAVPGAKLVLFGLGPVYKSGVLAAERFDLDVKPLVFG